MKDWQLQVGYYQNKMFNSILHYYQNNQFSAVIENVKDSTVDARLLELKGLSAIKLRDYNLAVKTFEKLIEIENKPVHIFHFGLANMNCKKFKEAISAFESCKNDQSLYVPASLNQVHCLFEIKEVEWAIVNLNKISEHVPNERSVWNMLLAHYRRNMDRKGLINTLTKSRPYIGSTIDWLKSQAYLHYINKDYILLIDYILSIDTENRDLKNLLAKAYSKIAKFENSANVYKEILIKEPNSVNNYNLAAAYSNLTSPEHLSLSIEYSDKCLEIDSNYHQAFYCKALALQKFGYNEDSLNCVLEALRCTIKIDYLYTKAELLNLLKRNTESDAVLDEILEIENDNNLALRLKGIIKLQKNSLDESEKYLKLAMKHDKTDQRAIAYYSIAKLAKQKKGEVDEFLGITKFVKEFNFDPKLEYDSLDSFNFDFEIDIKNHSLLRKNPRGLAARNGYLTDDIFQDNTKSINLYKKILLEKILEYIENLPEGSKHHFLRHKTKEFKISSWATWVKGDGFIDKHIHEDSWLSGAYYCRVPKITEQSESHQGYFEYGCVPNDITIPIKKERGYIKPVEGKLIIFPSYLYHQTIPHVTDEDRISIAFDLTPLSWIK